jgi:hypothetical protein
MLGHILPVWQLRQSGIFILSVIYLTHLTSPFVTAYIQAQREALKDMHSAQWGTILKNNNTILNLFEINYLAKKK